MNKQIDEMARVLNECCNEYDTMGNHIRNKCSGCECWSADNHCCCSYNTKEATALYNAGYRKASDVAEDIFAELKKAMIDEYRYPIIAELKKKYESEEVDKVKWFRQEPCTMTTEQFNKIYDDESEGADDELDKR